MNWKKLKEKYPDIWKYVYDGMIHDLLDCMNPADIELYEEGYKENRLYRIAHNAAFLACNAVLRRER